MIVELLNVPRHKILQESDFPLLQRAVACQEFANPLLSAFSLVLSRSEPLKHTVPLHCLLTVQVGCSNGMYRIKLSMNQSSWRFPYSRILFASVVIPT